MDMDRVSRLLRGLRPRQEKVLRLYFGLGCERPQPPAVGGPGLARLELQMKFLF
jgi:hypothetical protein